MPIGIKQIECIDQQLVRMLSFLSALALHKLVSTELFLLYKDNSAKYLPDTLMIMHFYDKVTRGHIKPSVHKLTLIPKPKYTILCALKPNKDNPLVTNGLDYHI